MCPGAEINGVVEGAVNAGWRLLPANSGQCSAFPLPGSLASSAVLPLSGCTESSKTNQRLGDDMQSLPFISSRSRFVLLDMHEVILLYK